MGSMQRQHRKAEEVALDLACLEEKLNRLRELALEMHEKRAYGFLRIDFCAGCYSGLTQNLTEK